MKEIESDSLQIISAVQGEFTPMLNLGLELPKIPIKQISRITGINPRLVLSAINSGEIIINSIYPSLQARALETKPNGRIYQRQLSKVSQDSQRWQRSFQFPKRNKGKTTKSRALARTTEIQINNTKIKFVPIDNQPLSDQETSGNIQRWLSKAVFQSLSPAEKFKLVLDQERFFPSQNQELINQKVNSATTENPFSFGCFICLNTPCKPDLNKQTPIYEVNPNTNQTRLTLPSFKRRTTAIIEALEKTELPFNWNLIIADTDATDIYGEWLKSDQSENILIFKRAIESTFNSSMINVYLWSELQESFNLKYRSDFKLILENINNFVDKDVLERSIIRRLNYFTNLGFTDNPEIRRICEVTARRNIALYASQGPIINQLFDCLIIADPDPLRLGRNQSLLAPDLPIWYPYKG